MTDTRKVRVTCPTCQNVSDVEVPFDSFDDAQLEKGIVTLSLKTKCGHACYVFIDKNFKMRGGQCADYELNQEAAKFLPLTNEQYQASEILLKYATEMVKMDVKDEAFIKSIAAEDKVDAIENALIHGDVKKAGSIIESLRKFAAEIDEKEFAGRLLEKIKSINKLIINNPKLDWDSLVLKDTTATNEHEYASMRGIHYERLRKIFTDLEFEVLEGRLPKAAVDTKRQRLVDLMDKE